MSITVISSSSRAASPSTPVSDGALPTDLFGGLLGSLLAAQSTPLMPPMSDKTTTAAETAGEEETSQGLATPLALFAPVTIDIRSTPATINIDATSATIDIPPSPDRAGTGTLSGDANAPLSIADYRETPIDATKNDAHTETPALLSAAKFAETLLKSDKALQETAPKAAETPPLTQTEALGGLNTHTATRTDPAEKTNIATPVYAAREWTNEFTQRITWLTHQGKQSAEITLNPPHLGPIQVSLSVDNGNASATFTAIHADVREAIETALPRLREMFAQAGISLGHTAVNAESSHQQQAFQQQHSGHSRHNDGETSGILSGTLDPARPHSRTSSSYLHGLVDTFA